VTNCPEYDESLRQCVDLAVWISDDAIAVWSAPPRTTPVGQPVYSDLAIEMCLTLRMLFKQPLRQARSTGRRQHRAKDLRRRRMAREKHKTKRKGRSWRKLHLGLNLVSGQTVCSDLTTDDIADPTALPCPLDQIDAPP
jgi:hypothetical protein